VNMLNFARLKYPLLQEFRISPFIYRNETRHYQAQPCRVVPRRHCVGGARFSRRKVGGGVVEARAKSLREKNRDILNFAQLKHPLAKKFRMSPFIYLVRCLFASK
jgi:hypothetical protein